jgi:REP element-mobilizing transposase RayT
MPSATWPVHVDPDHLYFITTSAVQHALVFQRPVIRRIIVDSLNFLGSLRRIELYAFVVMPNHIHLILKPLGEEPPPDIVRDLKKATANLILRQYENEGNEVVLEFFRAAVKPGQNQKRAVWEDDYQAKNIYSPEFLREKLEYVHSNPCQPHWQLADTPEAYLWSSAGFYLVGRRPLIPLSDARELLG